PLHLGIDRPWPGAVRHHLRRARAGQNVAAAGADAGRSMTRYARRRLVNRLALSLATAAAAVGLLWLSAILFTLLTHGLAGLDCPPPPGAAGGLGTAIFGSLAMTLAAILIGAPVGILAGTYLAEYSRYSRSRWLGEAIRFINDILLSAPSIIVGLFVYEILVL